MKLFGRKFVIPIMFHRTHTQFGGSPDITIRLRKGGSAGTMCTTSYTLQIVTQRGEFQWTFVWRPDVTKWYWKH